MAWGFTHTRDGRQRLASVLRALLIAQLVISLVLVIFCYNVTFKVMSLLKHIHRYTVFLLYGLILLQGYCMKLHYTAGFRLLSWLLRCPHWPRAALVTKLWIVSGSLVALNGLLVHAACKSTLKALMKELSSSLRIGMSHYLTEPTWKRIIDTMQVELNCCGIERPSDWHEIPWINIDFLNEESDLVMKIAGADGKVLAPVSPYSCCSPNVLTSCYHDPLQQWEWREEWWRGALAGASLNARACLDAVRAPLARATLAMHLFNILVILLQVVIVLLTYVVCRGALEAVSRGDWTEHHHTMDAHNMESEMSVGACALSLRRRRSRRKLRTRSYPYLS
ncbi:peripherin-2-like [Maniola jurtina]|uniref:peripherin-2-like n=1 Tax=Maniola jurtina TaxID=191418 RepID=UPI001E68D057|nr:peripherin-2-like [Maniola jurtina]XP_045768258.1 peripherin-2-like [Maniola jurtina]